MREEKVLGYTANGTVRLDVTDYARPPFYRGNMPLRYKAEKIELGTTRITRLLDYGSFRVEFDVRTERRVAGVGASIPGSARAINNGELLAQATVVGLQKSVGFEIEEIHYSSSGTPIFRCKSVISFDVGGDGYKAQEVVLYGKKTNDYFFLWPVGQ